MIIRTDAVVLHTRRYGDTSTIASLYTRDAGRLSVLAKGARTPKSPLSAALQPLTIGTMTIYHKAGRDLQTLSAAEVGYHARGLTSDLDRLTKGLTACELVLRTQPEHEPNVPLFELLVAALIAIDTVEHIAPILPWFRLNLARIMGFAVPDSGPAPDSPATALALDTGLMVPESRIGHGVASRISSAAYTQLRALLNATLEDACEVHLQPSDVMEIDDFLSAFFTHHMERPVTLRTGTILPS